MLIFFVFQVEIFGTLLYHQIKLEFIGWLNSSNLEEIFKEEFDWHMSDNHGWPKPNEEESDFEFKCNIC